MKKNNYERITNFLYECGAMKRTQRAGAPSLLSHDLTDNLASHTFRTAVIGWVLAQLEGADSNKVASMCLFHDLGETRSGDQNWIHKKYVKVFNEDIHQDQIDELGLSELSILVREYEARETKEALIAKDADNLELILTLREYEWAGNKEAQVWLKGKGKQEEGMNGEAKLKYLKTKSALTLGKLAYEISPTDWWNDLWSEKRR